MHYFTFVYIEEHYPVFRPLHEFFRSVKFIHIVNVWYNAKYFSIISKFQQTITYRLINVIYIYKNVGISVNELP